MRKRIFLTRGLLMWSLAQELRKISGYDYYPTCDDEILCIHVGSVFVPFADDLMLLTSLEPMSSRTACLHPSFWYVELKCQYDW